MSECYVIELLSGVLHIGLYLYVWRLYAGQSIWEQDRAFVLINQGQRQSSNLGFRTLLAE